MSESYIIDRKPVDPAELTVKDVQGEIISVPNFGIDCPVLDANIIAASIYTPIGLNIQLNLWGNQSYGTIGADKHNKSRIVQTARERAMGCADGTCPFIGKVATCGRRLPEDESTTD